MVGLLDIAPLTRKVPVGSEEVEVLGVSAFGIAKLLQKFPELRALMTGQDVAISPDRVMDIAPEAICAIIAAGCGYPGSEEAEQFATKLPAHIQLDLLGPILELTMPKGARPFFEQLRAAMRVLGADGSEKTADTQSQRPSKGSSATATG